MRIRALLQRSATNLEFGQHGARHRSLSRRGTTTPGVQSIVHRIESESMGTTVERLATALFGEDNHFCLGSLLPNTLLDSNF